MASYIQCLDRVLSRSGIGSQETCRVRRSNQALRTDGHNTSRGNLRRVRYRGHVTYHPLNFPHRVCKAMLSAASMPKYPYVLIVSRVRLHWGDLPLPTTLQIIGLETDMGEAAEPCTLGRSILRHAREADIIAQTLHDLSTHKDLSL